MATDQQPIIDLRLPDERIHELLDELDAKETTVDDCRRRSKRHHIRGLAVVIAATYQRSEVVHFRVRMRNVSQHGIGFLSPMPIMPNTNLSLELPTGRDRAMVKKNAVAKRCHHVGNMVYQVGAEFCARPVPASFSDSPPPPDEDA